MSAAEVVSATEEPPVPGTTSAVEDMPPPLSSCPNNKKQTLIPTPSHSSSVPTAGISPPNFGRHDKVSTFKLFVRNIHPGTAEEEVRAVFETVGRVVDCQLFRPTCAFVHMEDDSAAKVAIEILNQKLINGHPISVEGAKYQQEGLNVPFTRLRVENVPLGLSARELRTLFAPFGLVLGVEVTNEEAIVNIEASADVRSAINDIHGRQFEGNILTVTSLVDTKITYSPKQRLPAVEHYRRMDVPPATATHGRFHPPHNSFHGRGGGGRIFHPHQGRVLRDPPAEQRPGPYSRPDYFRNPNFSEDDPGVNSFVEPRNLHPAYPPPRMQSAPIFRHQSNRGHRFPFNNSWRRRKPEIVGVPEAEPGEAFQVPSMIPPGTFQPPKKFYADHARPKRKKKKKEPKEQPPLPDEPPAKPIPDFSDYYTIQPGSVLKPYPAPINPEEEEFLDDDFPI